MRPSPSSAWPRSRRACAFFGFSATLFCRPFTDGPPPKRWTLPLNRSPSPALPDPTPRKTNDPAKTRASRAKTHLAWPRMRPKKSCCSTDFALPPTAPLFRGARGACLARLPFLVAARAIGKCGVAYLCPGRGHADRRPVEAVAERGQPCSGRLVAEGARHPRVEERFGGDPQRTGGLVLASQVGVEHDGIVRRDGALDSRLHKRRQWMLLEGRDGPRADVGDRRHVEHDAAAGELAEQARVLDGANSMAQAVCVELLERPADRLGADNLPR